MFPDKCPFCKQKFPDTSLYDGIKEYREHIQQIHALDPDEVKKLTPKEIELINQVFSYEFPTDENDFKKFCKELEEQARLKRSLDF